MNKYIQKALLGTSAAAMAFATSCGGDEANPDLLVGEWEIENQQEGPARLLGGVASYEFTFNFASDGYFGSCYTYLNDAVIQEQFCYKSGEWEWLEKNKSLKLTNINGPRRLEGAAARLEGGPQYDIIFTFAELNGDSFLAVFGPDTDSDGELDYIYGAYQATKLRDEAEWTEAQIETQP